MPVASNFIFFKSLTFSCSISLLVTNFLGISHKSLISLFYFFINLIKLKPPSHSHQTANPVHRLRYLVCAWEREWQSCCFSDWRLLLLLHSRLLYQLLSLDCHSHRRNHCRESQAASETPQNNWRVLFLFFVVFVNKFSWAFVFILERYYLKGNSTFYFFFSLSRCHLLVLSSIVLCLDLLGTLSKITLHYSSFKFSEANFHYRTISLITWFEAWKMKFMASWD